jgi:biopolymer transport protein TolQ
VIERLSRVALLGSAWVLYLLFGLSIFSIGVMIERWFFFNSRRDDIDKLGDDMIALLKSGDIRGADQRLAKSPSIEATVLRPALRWLEGGSGAVEHALEAEMQKKRREIEKGMTSMGTIGNNAPFVGLLGTVIGVIDAFHLLGAGQSKEAMGNVMSGISEALVATGVGLFVALPAVVAYNVMAKKVNSVEANVGILGKQLLAYLKSQDKLASEMHALGEGSEEAAHVPGNVATAETRPALSELD